MLNRADIKAIIIPGLSAGTGICALLVGLRETSFEADVLFIAPVLLFIVGIASQKFQYRGEQEHTDFRPVIPFLAGSLAVLMALILSHFIFVMTLPAAVQEHPPFVPPDIPGRLSYAGTILMILMPFYLLGSCFLGLFSWLGGRYIHRRQESGKTRRYEKSE